MFIPLPVLEIFGILEIAVLVFLILFFVFVLVSLILQRRPQ